MSVENVVNYYLLGFIHPFQCGKLAGKTMESRDVGKLGIALHFLPEIAHVDAVGVTSANYKIKRGVPVVEKVVE